MSEVIHNAEQEFWRPPVATPAAQDGTATTTMVEACDRCGTEFMVGARFCHVCGAARPKQGLTAPVRTWTRVLEFHNIKQWVGLPTASLIAFMVGLGCTLGAIVVGFIFTAQTVLDWQAVQLWRIQWLLAATTAFLAAILLKRSSSSRES